MPNMFLLSCFKVLLQEIASSVQGPHECWLENRWVPVPVIQCSIRFGRAFLSHHMPPPPPGEVALDCSSRACILCVILGRAERYLLEQS